MTYSLSKTSDLRFGLGSSSSLIRYSEFCGEDPTAREQFSAYTMSAIWTFLFPLSGYLVAKLNEDKARREYF